MSKRKQKEGSKNDTVEKSFIAYIIKGNRQVITREVTASKRFKVEDDMYIVRDECIFYKNIDGFLQSVSYYREGNPNPYNFKDLNTGLSKEELNQIYAEDFYNIIVETQPENRGVIMFMMVIFNLIVAMLFMVSMLIMEFIL